jgi:DMSO/TMAO reductase YedYZ molybdopterin-dependent catalytic subunit
MNGWNDSDRNFALGRREFLCAAGGATLPLLWGGRLLGDDKRDTTLIPRETNPDNLEFPFHTLDSFLTPNDRFYVRNHNAVPTIEAKKWRLNVVGAVKKPLELTYDQLLDLPAETLTVTLECAGNGRALLRPKVKGVPWEFGAVGTAKWKGVLLSTVLDKVGLKPGAVDVVLEGADKGELKNEIKPVGESFPFARGMPLAKARSGDVLLAYRMNDAVLPEAHGFPLRAVVGGWYGMASIKWLSRIVVTEKPFSGYEQTIDYTVWERTDGVPSLTPITDMQVKASIARPKADETLPPNKDYRVHGAAWTGGDSAIDKVEVSTDGGKTWSAATLLGKETPLCWRLWEYTWKTPGSGKHTLMARATDKKGRVQPLERDADRRNYMINHVLPIEVAVGG